jgi:hypothetical protein
MAMLSPLGVGFDDSAMGIDLRFSVRGSRLTRIASVLVRFDHVAHFIVNADHSIM